MASVLIVDDSPTERVFVAGILIAHGFSVRQAEDGRQALAAIEEERPLVILVDLLMPEMDGLELVERVRRCYPGIPIILITGKGDEAVALKALRAGASTYLPKRHLQQSLVETIETVVWTNEALCRRDDAWSFLRYAETVHCIGNDVNCREALMTCYENQLRDLGFCDESDQIRVMTALNESLANAIEHGNLQLDSTIREAADGSYEQLANERRGQSPYKERKVWVTCRVTPSELTYIVRDEGPGFDFHALPDPTDPENLTRLSGRGLLLIRTFMDDVRFNESGNEITMLKRRKHD